MFWQKRKIRYVNAFSEKIKIVHFSIFLSLRVRNLSKSQANLLKKWSQLLPLFMSCVLRFYGPFGKFIRLSYRLGGWLAPHVIYLASKCTFLYLVTLANFFRLTSSTAMQLWWIVVLAFSNFFSVKSKIRLAFHNCWEIDKKLPFLTLTASQRGVWNGRGMGSFFREISVWEGQECADSTPILLSWKVQN